MNEQKTLDLSEMKPLTTDQCDACRKRALERVKTRIGPKQKPDPMNRAF